MLGVSDFLLGGVLPGLVALATRMLVLRIGAGDRLAWPLALALGFACGQAALIALGGAAGVGEWATRLPAALSQLGNPREASQWLPAGAALAAVVAWLSGGGKVQRTVAAGLAGALAIALPGRLLWGSVYFLSEWSRNEAIARVVAIGLAIAFLGWLIWNAPKSNPGGDSSGTLRAGLLAAVALGLAVVLATSGSLSYARLAGLIVASLVGSTLGAVGSRPLPALGDGIGLAAPVATLLIGGVLLLGFFYAEVTPLHAGLLIAAFAAAGLAHGPTLGKPWRAAALRVVCCAAPLVWATAGSAIAFNKAISQEPENPYANWSAE